MVIKVKKMTWAKYKSGGDGSAMVYEGGIMEQDKVVRVDQSEERSDGGFYADDHMIDHDNSVNSASVSIELAKVTDEMYQDALGYEKGTDSLALTVDESPYIGLGFVYGHVHCGVPKYRAYWYYKVQCRLGNRSFNTRGESTAYQTASLEGTAQSVRLTADGKEKFYEQSLELDSEAAAITWLKGRAGISGS